MADYDLGIWPLTATGRYYDKKITGPEKLVQRFLIEFFTAYGSDVYRPTRGTIFLTEWRKGVTNETQLFQIFALAEHQARINLKNEETSDDPDNERYVQTRITKIEIAQDTVRLHLLTESRDGNATVVVPLSTAN